MTLQESYCVSLASFESNESLNNALDGLKWFSTQSMAILKGSCCGLTSRLHAVREEWCVPQLRRAPVDDQSKCFTVGLSEGADDLKACNPRDASMMHSVHKGN